MTARKGATTIRTQAKELAYKHRHDSPLSSVSGNAMRRIRCHLLWKHINRSDGNAGDYL